MSQHEFILAAISVWLQELVELWTARFRSGQSRADAALAVELPDPRQGPVPGQRGAWDPIPAGSRGRHQELSGETQQSDTDRGTAEISHRYDDMYTV